MSRPLPFVIHSHSCRDICFFPVLHHKDFGVVRCCFDTCARIAVLLPQSYAWANRKLAFSITSALYFSKIPSDQCVLENLFPQNVKMEPSMPCHPCNVLHVSSAGSRHTSLLAKTCHPHLSAVSKAIQCFRLFSVLKLELDVWSDSSSSVQYND